MLIFQGSKSLFFRGH